jgi:hypothetical protein
VELVAYVGTDKENWGQITALINRFECEKVILVASKEADDFPINDKCEVIKIDSSKQLFAMKDELLEKLRKRISGDFEVAVSLASGNGKEHMALISALLSVPVGIKLVIYTKDGVQYLS